MKKLINKTEGLVIGVEYKKTRFKVLYALIIFILVCAVLCALIPVLWLFMAGFKNADEVFKAPFTFFPESVNLSKIVEVWKALDFGRYFLNTLILMVGSVFCAVVFNGLLAYAVSVVKPMGHKLVNALIMGSYMIPAVASLVPLYGNIIKLGLTGYAIYVPLVLLYGANAYYFMMFKNFFDTIPRSFFEAAKIDGASNLRMFFSITLPLSKPIIGVVGIFSMTATWADFLLPYLLLQDEKMFSVMVKIFNLQTTMNQMMDFGIDKYLMALAITIIPQILIFALFQKQITGTNAQSGVKG